MKVRIGDHEFEAEGSAEVVAKQFDAWKELIQALPAAPALASPPPELPPAPPAPPLPPLDRSPLTNDGIETAYRREGPVVTLSLVPEGATREPDAGLLVLLGHRTLLNEQEITGTRLMQGLSRSGISVARADRLFGDYMPQYVLKSGTRKGTRYRLTNMGASKAMEIVKELLSRVQ